MDSHQMVSLDRTHGELCSECKKNEIDLKLTPLLGVI